MPDYPNYESIVSVRNFFEKKIEEIYSATDEAWQRIRLQEVETVLTYRNMIKEIDSILKDYTICPICLGKKFIYESTESDETMNCPNCGGSGKVIIREKI